MTSKERRSLLIGILVGVLLAGAVAVGVILRLRQASTPATETAATQNAASTPTAGTTTGAAVPAAVQLSAEEQSKIGLQATEVRRESLTEEILASGRVEEPETAIATVSTRFGGRIEQLFVKYVGQPVQKDDPVATIQISGQPAGKGDPVSSIYSRELIAAAEEYKFALENREHSRGVSRPEAVAQADALLEASRVRLERYGVTPDQIDKVLSSSSDQPIRVTVASGSSGIARARKVAEGQFINAGDTLIELTDLTQVWVKANVFDADLPRIRPGLAATVTSDALPGMKLSGKVDFIEPQSDPQTRTTPVRIQVNNPGTRLKPGMVVQTAFRISLGNVLTVPREAVLDSGTEKIVYVAGENGVFEQRRIQTGTALKDRYPVTDGLKDGEKVVTNGVFLVDSQTRLTGGLTGMFGGSKSYNQSPAPVTAGGAGYKLTLRIDPDPPQAAKQNTLHVTLTDPAGKPVSDAQVRLTFTMPAMPAMNMPEMRNGVELKWTGSNYTGPIQIMVAGGWNVAIEARRGNEVLATTQTHINVR
jgi:RND family efflux transporter MFP subunit